MASMEEEKLKQLIKRYELGQCTLAEKQMVEVLYHEYILNSKMELSAEDIQQDLENIYKKLPGPISHKQTHQWIGIAAAVLIIGVLTLIYAEVGLKSASSVHSSELVTTKTKEVVGHPMQSSLILSDGRRIDLDQVGTGRLTVQDGVEIVKVNSSLITYRTLGSKKAGKQKPGLNTISTGIGKQLQIQLTDGSKIWMNAASKLEYPTFFAGSIRLVQLQGEGYFEVYRQESMPFVVHTDRQDIEVIGTHFNINSYAEEPEIRTTLLEGKIKVIDFKTKLSAILNPGEQAVLNDKESFKIARVNGANSIAWKNGRFHFQDSDLQTILRQFSRWYHVEFEIEGEMPDVKLWGEVHYSDRLEKAMEVLEFFGLEYEVKEKGNTKKVTIKSKS